MTDVELDDTDRAILRALQEDARTPFSEIARRIDMSSATVHDRVNRLKEAGVIEGYHAKVNPQAVGYSASAFVGLRVEQGRDDAVEGFVDHLREVDGVQEVHLTTGDWDVLIRVYAEDTEGLRELLFDNVASTEGFGRSYTMVVLGTEHDDPVLPV
ncbi:Lrp/AsnC family transcriptional regulator [Salinigranum halophilum]|uniref:Lrp/AsnC family transcriptional regulator n=1 Tax=Salinigranum halophilum TaxID=2565931 RepID=UPI001F337924|nr:Lrp/AsnC family transcriptional regulator [Salinigranum halophilum]